VQRRRVAVSAEAQRDGDYDQKDETSDKPLPVVEMSSKTLSLVLKAVHKSLLFQNLEDEHKEQVARVMHYVDYKKGDEIIVEGEEGNQFYIIETGEVDVFQKQSSGEKSPGQLVDNHGPGGSFGELALMYNAPRNATCVAVTNSRLRVLERVYFNRIVKEVGELRIKQYAAWLNQVEVLKPLTNQERQDLAETMEMVPFLAFYPALHSFASSCCCDALSCASFGFVPFVLMCGTPCSNYCFTLCPRSSTGLTRFCSWRATRGIPCTWWSAGRLASASWTRPRATTAALRDPTARRPQVATLASERSCTTLPARPR
jgi:hypothetical protein